MPGSAAPERRIVAIVVPELLCEIASEALLAFRENSSREQESPLRESETRATNTHRARRRGPPPLGVVLTDGVTRHEDAAADVSESSELESEPRRETLGATAELDAVNAVAHRYGVRRGQTIAEARVLVARLVIREVSRRQVLQALGRIAEMALAFGTTAAIEAPDTVWIDVTGSAHLAGGEAALVQELCSQVRAMGHVVHGAVASGPLLARAFARWANPVIPRASSRADSIEGFVISNERTVEELARLPINALPLTAECAAWLMRVGVFTVGELAALPRASAAARLGPNAAQILDLCEGRDPTPLVAYVPPRTIQEESIWDEPVSGYEPLRFVLRGLVARLSARLAGRGQAARRLTLSIEHDRAIARLQGVEPVTVQKFKLAAPLWKEEKLGRVISSRVERLKLKAPAIGLRLEATAVVENPGRQLDLSQVSGGTTMNVGSDELPVLLAELYADIGQNNVGVLTVLDAHRPEARSSLAAANLEPLSAPSRQLRSVRPSGPRAARPSSRSDEIHGKSAGIVECRRGAAERGEIPGVTRLLAEPLRLDVALRVGATVAIERRLYTIKRLAFEQRLDAVEWWSERPISRDYVRLWLEGTEGGLEALVFVDRHTGARFLQAIAD